jgi:murein DD-endopeptidase MepM/ murein hydrolase activator NlpD
MPIGTPVVAARAGIVKTTRSDSPDDGQEYGAHNYVFIRHADGTVAFYAHLMQDGVLVEYGDEVEAGQLIGYSGNSGQTGNNPHLHFGVYLDWPPEEGRDVPVNFRNASGQLDAHGGLAVWRLFEALPVDGADAAQP